MRRERAGDVWGYEVGAAGEEGEVEGCGGVGWGGHFGLGVRIG